MPRLWGGEAQKWAKPNYRTQNCSVAIPPPAALSGRRANLLAMGGPSGGGMQAQTSTPPRSITSDTKIDMTLFAEADRDGDARLSFAEFLAMMPAPMKIQFNHDQLNSWFEAADRNSDGFVDIHDYWRWSLGKLVSRHGVDALRAVFLQADTDGSGMIDESEFAQVAEAMGFGSVAHEVFHDLDDDGSGSVTYNELLSNLSEGQKENALERLDTRCIIMSSLQRKIAEARALEELEVHQTMEVVYDRLTKEARATVDCSDWVVGKGDAKSVLARLRNMLASSGAHVLDLIKLFDSDSGDDADAKLSIDEDEFYSAMTSRFGYCGDTTTLRKVYRSLDSDASGSIGYDDVRSTRSYHPLAPPNA